ncbi:MAG: hypothetical protein A3E77_13315 [Sphingopyxis sp. RIFCSPHIGHO2_12_FULL_65_19]|nr:MAG: hypothetical protein A3E77_13315 [Sphingopyxis sp. RIFCSPHIGHO2_12_FULL_65_19]
MCEQYPAIEFGEVMMSGKEQPVRQVEDMHGFFRTGTVRGVGNWTETHVSSSSSGGGGYIHNGSGHISAPTVSVSSTSTEVMRFFMEYADDDEEEVTIKGGGFAAREGQRVTVVRIGSRPGWGYNVAYHNHNTGSTFSPDHRLEWPLYKRPSRKMILFAPILVALLSPVVMVELWWVLPAGAFGWALYRYTQKKGEYQRLKAAVRERVDELLAEAKAQHGRLKSDLKGEAA